MAKMLPSTRRDITCRSSSRRAASSIHRRASRGRSSVFDSVHDAIAQGANVFGKHVLDPQSRLRMEQRLGGEHGAFDIAGISRQKLPESGPGPTPTSRDPAHPFVDVYGQIAQENRLAPELIQKYGKHP